MKITIEANNVNELAKKIAQLNQVFNPQPQVEQTLPLPIAQPSTTVESPTVKEEKEEKPKTVEGIPVKKKAGRKPKYVAESVAESVAEAVAEEVPVVEEAVEEAVEEKDPTIEDVKNVLTLVVSNKGLVTAKETLAKFGCSRISEMKEENYSDFVSTCKELLGA